MRPRDRTTRALVLAVASAVFLAVAGSAAPAVSAQGKITSDGPVTLDGTQPLVGESWLNSFTAFGSSIICPGSTYRGHKAGTGEPIASGATTFTVSPSYVNCTAGGLPATVQLNGCDYLFHLGGTTFTNQYSVTADIVCPKEAKIHISAYSSSSHAVRVCTTTIPPQTGVSGAIARSNGIGEFEITERLRFLTAERSGLCGSASTTSAEWHIDVTFSGTSALGSLTSVSISD